MMLLTSRDLTINFVTIQTPFDTRCISEWLFKFICLANNLNALSGVHLLGLEGDN